MTTEVNVLRLFTDARGEFSSPLGVVRPGAAPANDRQRIAAELSCSHTIFVEDPTPGFGSVRTEIFTPAIDLLFAGHRFVGAPWRLRERGAPTRSLQLRAGVLEVHYVDDLVTIEVFAAWPPKIALHELNSPQHVVDADPDDYLDDSPHYIWAWIDKSTVHIRSRALRQNLAWRRTRRPVLLPSASWSISAAIPPSLRARAQ